MTQRVRALLFGLGAIGAGIGRVAAQRDDIELAGAVDSAPDQAGRPLYDVLGIEPPPGAPGLRVGRACLLHPFARAIAVHAAGGEIHESPW